MIAKFSSPQAEWLFKAFSEAAEDFDNLAVLEAAAILVAQTIASGGFNLASADARLGHIPDDMRRDIALNWPLLMANKRPRQ